MGLTRSQVTGMRGVWSPPGSQAVCDSGSHRCPALWTGTCFPPVYPFSTCLLRVRWVPGVVLGVGGTVVTQTGRLSRADIQRRGFISRWPV